MNYKLQISKVISLGIMLDIVKKAVNSDLDAHSNLSETLQKDLWNNDNFEEIKERKNKFKNRTSLK